MARYIDADEVKKAIEESWDGCLGSYDSNEIVVNDLWVIDKVPTADVRKNGKWIWVDGVRCSECNHKLQTTGLPSFCPNCGAIMFERREDGTH